jgi:ribosomal protein S18 acetylase RimI-like enzyme
MRVEQLGLGWRSHVLACRFGAHVDEREDCIVVRTPSNPTHYWGNCLILPEPPRDEDLPRWLRCFEDCIGAVQPASRHVAIGVDAPVLTQALPSWRQAGFDEFDDMAVLVARADTARVVPAPRVDGLSLRRLRWPDEMEAAVELQVAARDASHDAEGYRIFRRRAMQRVMAMHVQGIADWYGAFVGTELAADCGLVRDEATGLARFQYVSTHPRWRRLGLCRALVRQVCRDAFERLGLSRLVMCADPHDVAIGIYRSVGFEPVQTHWCLQRRSAPEPA